MAELMTAYMGKLVRASDRSGQAYQNERASLVGEEGFLLLYKGRQDETLRFIPDRSADEMLEIPHGRRTVPLHTDTLLFETANSLYGFENVRRIR